MKIILHKNRQVLRRLRPTYKIKTTRKLPTFNVITGIKNLLSRIFRLVAPILPTGKLNKLYVLGGLGGVMVIGSIFLTIQTASNGLEVSHSQTKQKEALTKQQELQQILVESLSRKSLEEKSLELGFVKVTNLVYVNDGAGIVTANASKTESVAKVR